MRVQNQVLNRLVDFRDAVPGHQLIKLLPGSESNRRSYSPGWNSTVGSTAEGSRRWVAYQPRITSGYMVHKVTALKADPETGIERAVFDPMITPKGLAYLAEKNIGASL